MSREEMVALFRNLQSSWPDLVAELDQVEGHPYVDIEMQIRAQHRLTFDVLVQLQGDELHLYAGTFHLEWFPLKPDVVERFRQAVMGLLSGEYRIREQYIGNTCVKAQLQRPTARGWRTVGTSANLLAFIPWPRREGILRAGVCGA